MWQKGLWCVADFSEAHLGRTNFRKHSLMCPSVRQRVMSLSSSKMLSPTLCLIPIPWGSLVWCLPGPSKHKIKYHCAFPSVNRDLWQGAAVWLTVINSWITRAVGLCCVLPFDTWWKALTAKSYWMAAYGEYISVHCCCNSQSHWSKF